MTNSIATCPLALTTGASSGFGAAIAEYSARYGS